jgi:hypothetical protein
MACVSFTCVYSANASRYMLAVADAGLQLASLYLLAAAFVVGSNMHSLCCSWLLGYNSCLHLCKFYVFPPANQPRHGRGAAMVSVAVLLFTMAS